MYHQYAPFFSEFQYKLRTGGSLLYSWDVGMGVNFRGAVCLLSRQPVKLADPALPEEVDHRIHDDHDRHKDRTFGAELCLVFKETQPELYPGVSGSSGFFMRCPDTWRRTAGTSCGWTAFSCSR